jgi:YegS/Rv2252/BmrU family lipid kinase
VIINPVSGRRGRRAGEGDARAALAQRTLQARGIDAEIAVTWSSGHGAELAARFLAAGADLVVAWGGDGTINEVAGPLIASRAALGIVPSGSGDGLALGLGLPSHPVRALEVALSGQARPMDVGFLGSRHFLNVAGIGFDAVVADAFNRRGKRGALSYVTRGLSLVWSYRSPAYEIDLDGQVLSGERFLIGFANAPEYGNHLVLDQDADPYDGWLNAVVADPGPPLAQIWRARRLAIHPGRPAAGIHRMRVKRARIAGDDLTCHVDGEAFQVSGTVEVQVKAGAVNVVTSKRSK